MDINDMRVTVTVISLVLFLALMLHTYSRRRAGEHADAALLPFMGGDDVPLQTQAEDSRVAGQAQGPTQTRTEGEKA